MPPKLTIYRGLPASGKSTLAKKKVQELLEQGIKAINIDRDIFRLVNGFGIEPTGEFENVITAAQRAIMKQGFLKGWHVIESSTNLRVSYIKEMIEVAEFYGVEVEIIDVNVPIETCIVRDVTRANQGGHYVGEEAIRGIAKRFMPKGKFPAVPKANPPIEAEPYIPDITLPTAIIVDIDGTVAEMEGRSPYDYTLVSTDKPKQWVIDRVREANMLGHKIIFMSGREATCVEDTHAWITKYISIEHFELYMRAAGDTKRMDAIVKIELFDKYLRSFYNVLYCIDDRTQVINAYRAMGLNVMDVAGNPF
jgi:predicted kinase